MKDIELPPLSKFDHPEPRTMQWSDLELYAIKSYARAAIEADRAQRVPEKYDDTLMPFLALMRRELHANSGKGDRPGWRRMSPEVALLEIYWHTAKLSAAVKNNDGPAIEEHSADVANMAMMLLDVCDGLTPVASSATPAPAQQEPNGAPMNSASGVLSAIWDAMQNSADGDDLLNKLECLRDGIEQAVKADQEVALQELATDAQVVYGAYAAKHQEPPQQERGPMTDELLAREAAAAEVSAVGLCDSHFADGFVSGFRRAERHHGIRKD